jgi:4-hydroxy-3-polyprenylbenzoate decarboxylase
MAEAKIVRPASDDNFSMRVPYDDLRGWLAEAERLGEVEYVKGASCERDIGMAAEIVLHAPNGPCVVFDEIPGYPKGYRVLINFFSGRRMNLTLGFPTDLNKLELSEAFLKYNPNKIAPIAHRPVKDGPVLENVIEGDDVDVLKFPTPLWHPDDGGRYIGTGSYNVTKDPDSGWVNIGTYRVMIHDSKHLGFYISPGKHGRIHRDKYFARGESMPCCIVVGGDPMSFHLGCSEMPVGVCEYDVIGGMRGKPVECVTGKYTGLPFPANAEIVIEGFVHPEIRKPEGPFGEWTGYYGSDIRDEPVFEVKAIYHRNDPIILGCPPMRPPDELSRYRAVTRSAMLRESIMKAGVPDVVGVWVHEVGISRLLQGIAIKQRYPGHARQAGHVAATCHAGAYCGRYTVVVDDDIDVSNLEELIWAMLTRSDPGSSIDIIHNAWSTPLDPRIPPWERQKGNFTNTRAIIDACRPYHWRDQFPKSIAPTPEYAKEAAAKWSYLVK